MQHGGEAGLRHAMPYVPVMPTVTCTPLTSTEVEAALELAAQWLGESGTDALLADRAAHPELAVALHQRCDLS
jgi:hypothetical protein